MNTKRRKYTYEDDKRIILYIIQSRSFGSIYRKSLFVQMAKQMATQAAPRTWESLKNHFRRSLSFKLSDFLDDPDVPEEGIQKLLKIVEMNRGISSAVSKRVDLQSPRKELIKLELNKFNYSPSSSSPTGKNNEPISSSSVKKRSPIDDFSDASDEEQSPKRRKIFSQLSSKRSRSPCKPCWDSELPSPRKSPRKPCRDSELPSPRRSPRKPCWDSELPSPRKSPRKPCWEGQLPSSNGRSSQRFSLNLRSNLSSVDLDSDSHCSSSKRIPASPLLNDALKSNLSFINPRNESHLNPAQSQQSSSANSKIDHNDTAPSTISKTTLHWLDPEYSMIRDSDSDLNNQLEEIETEIDFEEEEEVLHLERNISAVEDEKLKMILRVNLVDIMLTLVHRPPVEDLRYSDAEQNGILEKLHNQIFPSSTSQESQVTRSKFVRRDLVLASSTPQELLNVVPLNEQELLRVLYGANSDLQQVKHFLLTGYRFESEHIGLVRLWTMKDSKILFSNNPGVMYSSMERLIKKYGFSDVFCRIQYLASQF